MPLGTKSNRLAVLASEKPVRDHVHAAGMKYNRVVKWLLEAPCELKEAHSWLHPAQVNGQQEVSGIGSSWNKPL